MAVVLKMECRQARSRAERLATTIIQVRMLTLTMFGIAEVVRTGFANELKG